MGLYSLAAQLREEDFTMLFHGGGLRQRQLHPRGATAAWPTRSRTSCCPPGAEKRMSEKSSCTPWLLMVDSITCLQGNVNMSVLALSSSLE